ncbi:cupin domain-containing protein [Vibrio pelagius]|uniref:cupin domain-containing protein n=1 Tax=Vibrio pelagius TaxID=28169 RepID=UPI00354ED110
MNLFYEADNHPWEDLGNGLRRKVVSLTKDLMAVHLCFDKGTVGAVYDHKVQEQIGYVVKGSFEVEVDGNKQILSAGDAFMAHHHLENGAKSLEHGSVLLNLVNPS